LQKQNITEHNRYNIDKKKRKRKKGKKKRKLEIWGKAQRESARRPKSDWGKLGVDKISPASKSRGPNSNALVYAERALST